MFVAAAPALVVGVHRVQPQQHKKNKEKERRLSPPSDISTVAPRGGGSRTMMVARGVGSRRLGWSPRGNPSGPEPGAFHKFQRRTVQRP